MSGSSITSPQNSIIGSSYSFLRSSVSTRVSARPASFSANSNAARNSFSFSGWVTHVYANSRASSHSSEVLPCHVSIAPVSKNVSARTRVSSPVALSRCNSAFTSLDSFPIRPNPATAARANSPVRSCLSLTFCTPPCHAEVMILSVLCWDAIPRPAPLIAPGINENTWTGLKRNPPVRPLIKVLRVFPIPLPQAPQ